MVEDPDDVTEPLAVLGNEVRMAILRALAEADGPLSFSELRERAGVDDSGRFNYHLNRLCEYFVRETGDGYDLGPAGDRVITAGRAPATADGRGDAEDGTVDQCPVCGERDCEKLFHVHLAPPWADPR